MAHDDSIAKLQEEVHSTAKEKGWWGEGVILSDEIAAKLCLVHSEISEALEDLRNPSLNVHNTYLDENGKPYGFTIELADAVIRIMDLSAALDLDLEGAIVQKMEYNKTRPHRHGGKRL